MSAPRLSTIKLALATRTLWSQDGALRVSEPIAVVGMGLRFPGGINDPESLWEALLEGRDLISEVPADRWDSETWYSPDPATPGRISTKWAGFLEDIRGFDAAYFDITAREAERMDPQQRIALEVACEAVENAGIPIDALRNSATGVFFSSYHNDYEHLQYADPASVSGRTLTGSLHSVIPNRISYALGLRGPSMSIDSACSSSLVACHVAAQSLRNRDCDVALVGGVNLIIAPELMVALSKGGFMSPTGHCWTFDANADGFVRGEGCAVVVLKRLSDAVAAGDQVLGVIRGSAVNQDGQTTTLSAPNGLAQAEMLRAALRSAGLEPDDISYIEAHGTGTELGDPIETDAIGSVFRDRDPGRGPCWIGSLKSNMGHLEAAAGLAGLIKAVLVVRNGVVPPHALFTRLNPHIDLSGTGLDIARAATSLTGPSPRRAGVSAFGIGGTNAHVIVEEAPAGLAQRAAPIEAPYLLPISARSADSLRELARRYAQLLRADGNSGAIAAAAARRRRHYTDYRAAAVGGDGETLAAQLDRIAAGAEVAAPGGEAPQMCFVFSGQGTQWPGMALGLYAVDREFRAALDDVDAVFARLGGVRPLEELSRAPQDSRLDRTDVAQATTFAVQVALLRTLAARGIRPALAIGHSVGELAAAHAAGLLSLDDAVQAVIDRGSAMQAAFNCGRMVAVRLTESDAVAFVRTHQLDLAIAAVNGPVATVLSGAANTVDRACELLEAAGVRHSRLDVRFAFHSPLMSGAAASLRAISRQVASTVTDVRFISTVTGQPLTSFSYDYLADNVASAVRFHDAVKQALSLGVKHFVEVGPHPALTNAIVETAEAAGVAADAAFCQHRERPAKETMLQLVAKAYGWGCEIRWTELYPDPIEHVRLPTYPWAHKPYWLPETTVHARAATRNGAHPGVDRFPGRRVDSPVLRDTVFELTPADTVFTRFRDHAVAGSVRVPGTGLIELFRSAAESAGVAMPLIRDVVLMHAVEPDAVSAVQTILSADVYGPARICVRRSDGEWIDAATATIAAADDAAADRARDIAAQAIAVELVDVDADALYQSIADRGLPFGDGYRLLRAIQSSAIGAAGEIDVEAAPPWAGLLNPAILDAAAHLCVAVLDQDNAAGRNAFLPWAVDACHVFGPAGAATHGAVLLRERQNESASFDVVLLDPDRAPVALLEGWRLRRTLLGVPDLRVSSWRRTVRPARTTPVGTWLVVGDADGLGVQLSTALTRAGASAIRADIADPNTTQRLAAGDWDGVVHIACAATHDSDALIESAWRSVTPLLDAARAQPRADGRPRRVVVVTRGLQAIGAHAGNETPLAAAAVGVMRALRAEQPELSCTTIDLDPTSHATSAEEVEHILDAALAAEPAAEIAVRDGERYTHGSALSELETLNGDAGTPVRLVHTRPGTLDGFELRPLTPEAVPAGHVRIRVLAAGLNFRDVLTCLGSYAGPAEIGNECCGIVTETGEGVVELRPGDRVVAFWPGCYASYVTVPIGFVAPAPTTLSPAECATLPVAYGTAWHALVNIGRIQSGQSVLIHAGAGGVGQAAIQLAQMLGARVYATAGTPEKRAFLVETCGVAAAFDSRSASFASELLQVTGREGVDLVLNSLIGDLIPAGVACLKPNGVFVELGKREILTRDEVDALRADVHYEAFDLRDVALADPALLPGMFRDINAAVDRGALRALPFVTFPLAQAEAGFRRMARAQHIGKIVFIPPPVHEPADEAGWTVVTGGTGAMGSATVQWLLEQGERRIAVWARRAPDEAAADALQELRDAYHAEIEVRAVDVADEPAVEAALDELRTRGPITGVVHAAGVLDDATVLQITRDSFDTVVRPKVAGAWNLHRATLRDPVQRFVLYSAVGPLVDASGQGSYAAANAFLDALAVMRRGLGLPAVSIRWGLFRSGGMAARMTDSQQQRWIRKGLGWLSDEAGGALFEKATTAAAAEVFAIETSGTERTVRRSADAPAERAELLDRIASAPADARLDAAVEYLVATVTSLLSLPEAAAPDAPLRDLGLDSLSAIELRNMLTVATGKALPATLAFDYPTITAIAGFLLRHLGLTSEAAPTMTVEHIADAVDEIDAMSDEEAEALLLQELGIAQDQSSEAR